MRKIVLVNVALCALLAVAGANSSVCKGIWKLDRVEKCENDDQYPIPVEVIKRKLDRNTDGFSVNVDFPEDFGPEYVLRMESYEKCDGGYKPSDVITGGACDTVNQLAKDNFQELLAEAGVETKDCPIPKGKYEIKDYKIDYTSLPEQGKCGDHMWNVYLMKDGTKLSCIRAYSTFTASEDEYEEDDDS